jgi:hypothetical protein
MGLEANKSILYFKVALSAIKKIVQDDNMEVRVERTS